MGIIEPFVMRGVVALVQYGLVDLVLLDLVMEFMFSRDSVSAVTSSLPGLYSILSW